MTRAGTWTGVAVLAGIALAMGYFVWMTILPVTDPACDACGRPIYDETRVAGLVDGEEHVFCCPTCALTDHHQTKKAIEVTRLSDHATREPVKPDDAYIVEGSNVNHCLMSHSITDHTKHSVPIDFDRCAPSMIAFASREAARTFAGKQGGRVLSFREIQAEYRK